MIDFKAIALRYPSAPVQKEAPKLLTVDGNWLLQRFYHAAGKVDGEDVERDVKETALALGLDKTVILFDSGRSALRTSIFPAYKANRPAKDEGMIKQFARAKAYLKDAFMTLSLENTEADDLAAWIVNRFKDEAQIWLYSIDHDWLQLLEEGKVFQIRPDAKTGLNRVYSHKLASEEVGYDIKKWPFLAAFTGDPSDNVPSSGIKANTALTWLKKYNWSLPSVIRNEKKAQAAQAALWRNYKLTRLTGSCIGLSKEVEENLTSYLQR